MRSFPALLGRRGGELQLHRDRVVFQLDEDPGVPIVISNSNLEITLGGTNSHHYLLTDRLGSRDAITIQDEAFLVSLAEFGHAKAQSILSEARRRRRARWAILGSPLVLTIGLALLIPVLFSMLPVAWLNGTLSHAQEKEIGKRILPALVDSKAQYAAHSQQAILKIASRLAQANPELQKIDFEFRVSPTEDMNAFALPGGIIVLYRGLLMNAETAEEVAGVLAHEMAHVERRHTLRSLVGRVGYLGGFMLLSLVISPDAAIVLGQSLQIATLKYSRDDEREADRVGYQFLVNARVNPEGMIRFFQKLEKKELALLGDSQGVTSAAAKFFSTHPLSSERVDTLTSLSTSSNASKPAANYLPLDVTLDDLRRGF